MKNFGVKLRLIFVPFFVINIGCIVLYSFLRWLLFIHFTIFNVEEEILDFGGPLVFPWILILIWLRPRIKLLNLKNKNGKGDPLFAYMLVASMAMAPPIMVAQAYLETATGRLTALDRISQIDSLPQTKYYSVKAFYADKRLARIKPKFKISGKYNDNFDMYIYAAVPIYDKMRTAGKLAYPHNSGPGTNAFTDSALIVLNGMIISKDALARLNPRLIRKTTLLKGPDAVQIYGDRAKKGALLFETGIIAGQDTSPLINDPNADHTPSAWLAVKYEKTISNRLPHDEKDKKYEEFAAVSDSDFKTKQFDTFVYLDRVPYGPDLRGYQDAINSDDYGVKYTPKHILLPVSTPFNARNGSKLPWIFAAIGIGSVIFLITLLIKPLRKDAMSADLSTEQQKDRKLLVMWTMALIIPRGPLLVTRVLVQLNLLIFIIMALSGLGILTFEGRDVLNWGANFRPNVVAGEYWRLLTNTFLHGGLLHVIMNMYGLFFAGLFLEPVMGRAKYLITYLVCGITASIASVWWHPATVSVGASGAIFGLFGALFALASVNAIKAESRKAILTNVAIFVGYNLLMGMTGGIDNAAHIGGLLSGLILGYVLHPFIKIEEPKKRKRKATQKVADDLTEKDRRTEG